VTERRPGEESSGARTKLDCSAVRLAAPSIDQLGGSSWGSRSKQWTDDDDSRR
jgi:hypothetical protein